MPRSTSTNAWKPIDVESLEKAAFEAVKSDKSTIVVAGPGAGKTELLAQRACFLLQTGKCPSPRKILAISFKRDAARNLNERVTKRCGAELSYRFHSMTFDAFAKSLLDRFRRALPMQFRPSRDYEIIFNLDKFKADTWLRDELPLKGSTLSEAARRGIPGQKMYSEYFIGEKLTPGEWTTKPPIVKAAAELWRFLINDEVKSRLNFQMIGMLAELVLRHNPLILSALRSAYSFVFLDEFQDTSLVHYRLTTTAFQGSQVVVTAVGDNKQRINKWAGALDGIFEKYANDFKTEQPIKLLMNYRSAPELVRIQGILAEAIDSHSVQCESAVKVKPGESEGECLSFVFSDHEQEAKYVAEQIGKWKIEDKLSPRDICVLCRQRPPIYVETLQKELEKLGIASRIESDLQDLLTEPLTLYILHVLRLCTGTPSPNSWKAVVDCLSQVKGFSTEREERKESNRLLQFTREITQKTSAILHDDELLEKIVKSIMQFMGEDEFRSFFPHYSQGTFYEKLLAQITKELKERMSVMEFSAALDDFEGTNTIPIMTMHKSKGLEYHTVIFIGLEDAALFNFGKEPEEEMCGLFVALSRAKMRAVFTFSESRPDRTKVKKRQSKVVIKSLYEILGNAGVEPQRINGSA